MDSVTGNWGLTPVFTTSLRRLLVFHLFVFRIDDVAFVLLLAAALRARLRLLALRLRGALRVLRLGIGVDALAELLRGLRERLGLRVDVRLVVALHDALEVL